MLVNFGGYVDGGLNIKGLEYSLLVVIICEGIFLYFFSDGYLDSKSYDIYMSCLCVDGSFGFGVCVVELSSDVVDLMFNVCWDGFEIVFSSNCGSVDLCNQDIWYVMCLMIYLLWMVCGLIDNFVVNIMDGVEICVMLFVDGICLYFGCKYFVQVLVDLGDVYVSR